MGIWYATREDVTSALDIKLTARNYAQVDAALDSASRAIEGRLHRRFYPETDTRVFDHPDENRRGTRTWRLWVDEPAQIVSVSTLSSGGTTIAGTDYFLEPANVGPPFNRVEIDLDSSAAFGGGNTHQRNVSIAGVFGYDNETVPAGALAEALDDSETEVQVTDAAKVGVGDVIICESERMVVTDKAMIDTTINKTAGATTAEYNDDSMTVSGAGLVVGEVVAQDSERMLIVDIAGTTVTVKRAWDGTVLDTHSAAEDIFALRSLTVVRGALGSTAAAHNTATALTKVAYPGLIRQLAIAEAINVFQQNEAAWARTVGTGENEREMAGKGLESLWSQAVARYGRKLRVGAV